LLPTNTTPSSTPPRTALMRAPFHNPLFPLPSLAFTRIPKARLDIGSTPLP
jgi:hypothetical protein